MSTVTLTATSSTLQAVGHHEPKDVHATFNYFSLDPSSTRPPYNYTYTPPKDTNRSNVLPEPHPAIVRDVRGKESEYTMDTSGFQFVTRKSRETLFEDDEQIKAGYYAEVEALLKDVTGAKRVVIFDHTIRCVLITIYSGAILTSWNVYSRPPVGEPTETTRGPVARAHVDQTYEAGIERIRLHLPPADAERYIANNTRVRIINVWRPIENTVAHDPLAFIDFRTLAPADGDLVPVEHIYPHRVGSTLSVKYNPDHHWHYLSDQTTEEVALIKCFDTAAQDGSRAKLTPHSAFHDDTSPVDAPQRQSIEVRALVIDDE